MATISVNIPDAVLPRVLDAFATAYNYNAEKDGTKADFAQTQVARFITDIVSANEAQMAVEKAWDAATIKAEKEITIS